jgi:hypothetical protein
MKLKYLIGIVIFAIPIVLNSQNKTSEEKLINELKLNSYKLVKKEIADSKKLAENETLSIKEFKETVVSELVDCNEAISYMNYVMATCNYIIASQNNKYSVDIVDAYNFILNDFKDLLQLKVIYTNTLLKIEDDGY